jgi:hypothetical protein
MSVPFYAGQKLRASRLNQVANSDIFDSVGGCSLSTTSATYVDITNASKSFTKLGAAADSDLIVELSLSLYSTVNATVVKLGVNVNSADSDVSIMPINTANAHETMPTGAVRIAGLGAGTYTVKARALRVSGTGTVTIDTNDTVTMVIQERAI